MIKSMLLFSSCLCLLSVFNEDLNIVNECSVWSVM